MRILQTILTIVDVITLSSVFHVRVQMPLTPIFLQKAVIKTHMLMVFKAPELPGQRESIFQIIRQK